VSADQPLAAWSDRRLGEWGRAICAQRRLPSHPEVAAQQAAVLEEWTHRWRQRGPTDLFGQVELGLIGELADQLRRIADADRAHRPSPPREVDGER
jgi:hypothetical protein